MSNYDVFLSYATKDLGEVRELARALERRKLRVWMAEEAIAPGERWMDALERIISTVPATLVLVGAGGIAPWEQYEVRVALEECVRRKMRVVPVLLPGAPARPELPLFLKTHHWVDLRQGITDQGLARLEWGITGKRPDGKDPGGGDGFAVDWRKIGSRVAIVVALLVGGYLLWDNAAGLVSWARRQVAPASLELTVRVRGPGGPGDVIGDGSVYLELAADRREQPLNRNGEAHFRGIPGHFRADETFRVGARVAGYVGGEIESTHLPESGVLELSLQRQAVLTVVTGTVLRSGTGQPVVGAEIDLDSGRAVGITNGRGDFRIEVDLPDSALAKLRVSKDGELGYDDVTTLSGPISVLFDPQ